jgi:hypothetical protein
MIINGLSREIKLNCNIIDDVKENAQGELFSAERKNGNPSHTSFKLDTRYGQMI